MVVPFGSVSGRCNSGDGERSTPPRWHPAHAPAGRTPTHRTQCEPGQRQNQSNTHRDTGDVLLALITRHLHRLSLRRRPQSMDDSPDLPPKRGGWGRGGGVKKRVVATDLWEAAKKCLFKLSLNSGSRPGSLPMNQTVAFQTKSDKRGGAAGEPLVLEKKNPTEHAQSLALLHWQERATNTVNCCPWISEGRECVQQEDKWRRLPAAILTSLFSCCDGKFEFYLDWVQHREGSRLSGAWVCLWWT